MAQVRAVRRMNRPGCNWGCLLAIAAIIAIDAAAIYAIRALVLGLMAMAVAACWGQPNTETGRGPSFGAAFSVPGDTLATIWAER